MALHDGGSSCRSCLEDCLCCSAWSVIVFRICLSWTKPCDGNLSATRRSPLFQECAQSPLPFPYTFECEPVEAQQRLEEQCLGEIERTVRGQAGFYFCSCVEPVVGANGYLFASDEFFQRLRQLTQRLGILMICDEIQMGLGRLGSLFACASQGWVPICWCWKEPWWRSRADFRGDRPSIVAR